MRALLLAAVCTLGCGAQSKPDAGIDAGPNEFIAVQGDFSGYPQWHTFDLGFTDGDSAHFAGHRVVYLKQDPPHGATEWPVGTLLVKYVEADGGARQIFGMAKRGGDFNPDGAVGWEWFQIAPDTSPPFFLWRGAQPPPFVYNNGPSGCDDCHGAGMPNDYVLGGPLHLSSF
ncbi:MAG: hypothetical protein QM723_02815 [Myxococcaceae bacterium]